MDSNLHRDTVIRDAAKYSRQAVTLRLPDLFKVEAWWVTAVNETSVHAHLFHRKQAIPV